VTAKRGGSAWLGASTGSKGSACEEGMANFNCLVRVGEVREQVGEVRIPRKTANTRVLSHMGKRPEEDKRELLNETSPLLDLGSEK